jgi:chromosome segregation ATPase
MNEEPPKDLATRAFYKRVLDEFAAVRKEIAEFRSEQAEMRQDIGAMRADIGEIRSQQAAMARNIASLDQRVTALDEPLTSLEQRVDARLQETLPIWEAVQEQLRKISGKFDLVLNDLYEVRLEVRGHERRLTSLENRPV